MAEKKIVNLENPQFRGPTKMDLIESGDGGKKPFGYAGPGVYPSASGDALMGRVAEARARAIYEAHGRGPNAVARMKLDPSYAVARAAGIQLPGDGMVNTYNPQTGGLVGNPGAGQRPAGSGGANPAADRALRNSISYRDAGAAMRGAGDAKPVSYDQYGGPISSATTKGPRLTTPAGISPLAPEKAAEADKSGRQAAEDIASGKSKPPAPMIDPTSPAPAQPQQEQQRTPTVEGTKGTRITTKREDLGTTRGVTADENSRIAGIPFDQAAYNKSIARRDENLAGNNQPITVGELTAKGYGGFGSRDPSSVVPESDASVKMVRAEERNSLQDSREAQKKEYDAKVQSEARKDQFAKYRTEAGDTEIAQRTGEVQDRSRYGGDRVAAQKTYTNKAGREMVGNTMQRPDGSTYFVGLNSADQNKADTFNANTRGGSFNQYNNFSAMPKDYKATAEDIRANYAFGAPAGQQGSLTASPDDALGRGNRRQLEADTASYSAGSNNSRIDSRGQQSSILAGGPAEKPQSQSFSISSPGLPFQSEQQDRSPTYSGPDSGDEKKKKRAESSKPLPV